MGYVSTSNNTSRIFANAVDKIFFSFGETIQNGLIKEARKQTLPQNFAFPYYSIVRQSIMDFLGEPIGKMVLEKINQELTNQTNIEGSIEEILNEISKSEVLEKIKNFSGHEHVIYFWKKENTRDKTLNEFFQGAKGPKGMVSNKISRITEINEITYSELFENKVDAIKKTLKFLSDTQERNDQHNTTRFAGSDCTKWFDNDLGKEFLELENQAEVYIKKNNISAICAYNIENVRDESVLREILDCHKFVLLDKPYEIYERGN